VNLLKELPLENSQLSRWLTAYF